MDEVVYDRKGRMMYNPKYHPNQGKLYTIDEMIYLSKYSDIDGLKSMSYALGKTETSISNKITLMKVSGQYDFYRSLTDEQWENILERKTRHGR